MLEKEEIERYNRHLLLTKIGVKGQEKLKAAKVLVIGAGGLGCPALQYLTAAGVGTIGIIDFDTVDVSNLQRQILFTTNDIGKNKATAAANRLKQLNPFVHFEVYPEKLTTTNALALFKYYDLVLDGTDNFSTRYLVNDAAVITNTPLVYGSIYLFEGQISVFNYQNGPSYRCLFPEPPVAGSIKNCNEIGVLGVLPGVVGTQQANEALKLIVGIGKPLSGKLMLYNALDAAYTILQIQRSDNEVEKVLKDQNTFEKIDYDLFCGVKAEPKLEKDSITLAQLKLLENDENTQLIDLRELWEEPRLEATNLVPLPMDELTSKISLLQKNKKIVLMCQTGIRSAQVKTWLEKQYGFTNLVQLKGGLKAYDK